MRRTAGARRHRGVPSADLAQQRARRALRRFKQGSVLVVALTALLLLLVPEGRGQEPPVEGPAVEEPEDPALDVPEDPAEALGDATSTLYDLTSGLVALTPRIGVALLCLLVAWGLARVLRLVFRRLLVDWKRADAVAALSVVVIWLLAFGAALSVVAGDARALLGSVGLTGLALSWALQAPIESFTGWLLNSFRGYYRVGDRIAVGEVFGDVYRIDLLNTTVWEAGGPDKPVQGAQPTGALVSFPNSELLRAYVTNFTRDFPWVWDEVTVGIANESDLQHAVDVARRVAREVVGHRMEEPAQAYLSILQQSRLNHEVADEPQVFLSGSDFWTQLTIRYLVPARERRLWASRLYQAVTTAFNAPESADRVLPAAVLERRARGRRTKPEG